MFVLLNGVKLELDETKHYALTILSNNEVAVYEFDKINDVCDEDAEPNKAYIVKKNNNIVQLKYCIWATNKTILYYPYLYII